MMYGTNIQQRDFFVQIPQPWERDGYPASFFLWLNTDEGFSIWRSFERKALLMAARRPRYSAMAIAQVIRWETDLQDGSEFKLNNNWVPGLARLWMFNHGHAYPRFFELRDSLGRTKR